MAMYRYAAVAEDGTEVQGKLEAASPSAAAHAVVDQGLHVRQVKEHKSLLSLELTRKRVPRAELMHLSRQLAAFIRAGIPILDALEVIGDESGNKRLGEVLIAMAASLRAGETFSTAAAAHPDVFPPVYIGVLRSAELTGHLDLVLDQLAQYLERDLEARRKIRSALAYPAVIGVMSVVTVGIMAIFVLPRFKTFFASLDATLPLTTRLLLRGSNFLGQWWFAVAGAIAALAVLYKVIVGTSRGAEVRDGLKLRLPGVGDVVQHAVIERFCRVLASMVQAGVPLPEAMQIASDGTQNRLYQKALDGARQSMLEGEGLARPIARTGLFPAAVTQMVRVGEDTGSLDTQLNTAAAFYEQELAYKLKKLTTLFEPAAILFMGLVVGFVAVALVQAMYGVYSQAGGIG